MCTSCVTDTKTDDLYLGYIMYGKMVNISFI